MAEKNVNLFSLGKASYPGQEVHGSFHEDHEKVAAELLHGGSIEFSYGHVAEITEVARLLPYGMPVLIPHLPGQSLDSRLELLSSLHKAGFDPVPHISARKVASEQELLNFLTSANKEAAVHRVLLVGGDAKKPAGPYRDSLAILATGILNQAGMHEVGFAGYPEGHPSIKPGIMFDSLIEKLELARSQGLGAHVITQFSLLPTRIVEFCTHLATAAPGVGIYAGLAGPGKRKQLLRYARYCGVSASLSAVGKVGVKIAQLANPFEPEKQLGLLTSYNVNHPDSNLIGIHVFSFGGFNQAAQWIAKH